MDTKNNTAYMITLLVISIIVLIGGAYAYFTASMSSGETKATLRVGAGQLKIKFAPVGTKTFTLKCKIMLFLLTNLKSMI